MLNFDLFNKNDYNRDLATRDKLADSVTGEVGYGASRDYGNATIKNLMASRLNKNTTPNTYGNTGLSNFNEAIANINPSLYDNYATLDNANKAALESANKKVGEDTEVRKSNQDMRSAIATSVLDTAKTGATLGISAYDKAKARKQEQADLLKQTQATGRSSPTIGG